MPSEPRRLDLAIRTDGAGRARIRLVDYLEPRGIIDHVTTVPDATNQPTANWDIELFDQHGNDLLTGQLLNRSNSADQTVWPFNAGAGSGTYVPVSLHGDPELWISNTGADKGMGVTLILLRE